jgi:hypothetical protein
MMLIFGILIGLIVGAAIILAWAFILGQQPKPKQSDNAGFHYAGLGDVSMETSNAFMLKKILEEVDKNSLYEVRPRIN